MNYELVSILTMIIATQCSLAALIRSVHKEITELGAHMARLEGLFEGFTGTTSP